MKTQPSAIPPPLGDLWQGECQRPGAPPEQPSHAEQVTMCNTGYAAGRCSRFPEGGPDAVRFAIAAEMVERVRVRWCIEQNHLPHSAGEFVCEKATGVCTPHPGGLLAIQTRAYVASYRRRRGE